MHNQTFPIPFSLLWPEMFEGDCAKNRIGSVRGIDMSQLKKHRPLSGIFRPQTTAFQLLTGRAQRSRTIASQFPTVDPLTMPTYSIIIYLQTTLYYNEMVHYSCDSGNKQTKNKTEQKPPYNIQIRFYVESVLFLDLFYDSCGTSGECAATLESRNVKPA